MLIAFKDEYAGLSRRIYFVCVVIIALILGFIFGVLPLMSPNKIISQKFEWKEVVSEPIHIKGLDLLQVEFKSQGRSMFALLDTHQIFSLTGKWKGGDVCVISVPIRNGVDVKDVCFVTRFREIAPYSMNR